MKVGDYRVGARYRVLRPGARLSGMMPTGPYCQKGWRRDLEPGDVLTYKGRSMTFGDGVPAMKWAGPDGEWLANDCTIWPYQGGMWGGMVPMDGLLEEVTDEVG